MAVNIHPTAIVDSKAELADGVSVGPYSIVGPDVKLHENVELVSHVNLTGNVSIGADCKLFPFVTMGFPPQDFKHKGGDVRIEIGERSIFREMANIHPGTDVGRRVTKVGDDCFIMVGTHLAHDVIVGNGVTLTNHVQIGGFVTIGDYANLGISVAVHQFTRIGAYAFVGALAWVTSDIIPYGSVTSNATAARLAGLNVIGLKRRGLTRDEIRDLRTAFRLLFAEEGSFSERLEEVEKTFADRPRVQHIVDFIKGQDKRPICMPHTGN